MTKAEEIADFQQVRPHLIILGAGASRAAFPQGERQGRRLPLMADFTEIVPVAPIVQRSGVEWERKNFQEGDSLLSQNEEYSTQQTDLDEALVNSFS